MSGGEDLQLVTKSAACPYCHEEGGFVTNGRYVKSLSKEEFMSLLNSGWRRFGGYLWKPDASICCRQFPIRVNVHTLFLNNDKKKVWKNIEKYCRKGEKGDKPAKKKNQPATSPSAARHPVTPSHGHHTTRPRMCPRKHEMLKIDVKNIGFHKKISDKCSLCMEGGVLTDPKGHIYHCSECSLTTHGSEGCSWHKIPKCPMGHKMRFVHTPNPTPCDVCRDEEAVNTSHYACDLCEIRTHETCRWPRVPPCHSCGLVMQYCNKNLPGDYIAPFCDVCHAGDLHKDQKGYYHCPHCLTDTHRDGCRFKDFSRHIIGSIEQGAYWEYIGTNKLRVEVKKPEDTEEKYELFQKYQRVVHGEGRLSVLTIGDAGDAELGDRELYQKYLIESPLDDTYHFEYYANGKLFMVTVADLVTDCINSVYCFYDPDLKKLTPGKFSVLFEIEWMKKQHLNLPTFNYYYLGMYFNHSKMKYKADYKPSEILLPSGAWVTLDLDPHAAATAAAAAAALATIASTMVLHDLPCIMDQTGEYQGYLG
eukprot:TRINITY_DN9526_c1_g1_i1.p1 TRINITY_DN9526_c1_g1~~TRINITY_DN9526_c1_g1_i1.p1  ORF type:complete len:551 (+),score=135.32 TRINITY_DN9526_c1_g1_i1:57-1655(+)